MQVGYERIIIFNGFHTGITFEKKKQKLITIKRITRICCIMHFTHSINDCLGDLFVPFLATGACVCNSYTCLIVTAAGIQ